jgi:hypothetical protein
MAISQFDPRNRDSAFARQQLVTQDTAHNPILAKPSQHALKQPIFSDETILSGLRLMTTDGGLLSFARSTKILFHLELCMLWRQGTCRLPNSFAVRRTNGPA